MRRDEMRRGSMPSSLIALALAALLGAAPAAAKTKKPAAAPDAAAEPAKPSLGAHSKSIEKTKWGEVDGKEVDVYTLINKNGVMAKVTNFGAILTELDVPDRKGKMADVVLGWDTLA